MPEVESERYVLSCDEGCGFETTSPAEAFEHNHDEMVVARYIVIDTWDRL